MPLLEWGYPVLVATLVQALLASVLLILLPLLGRVARRRQSGALPAPSRAASLVYFAAIGFAFMFIEIAFIQKFVLFLSHPLYAVAVVLFAFLLFAGLGSRRSGAAAGGRREARGAPVGAAPVVAIGALALCLPRRAACALPAPDAAARRREDR